MDRITLLLSYLVVFSVGFMVADTPVQYDTEDRIRGERSASANIVAVSQNGDGTIGQVKVSIEPGNGRVLLDTDPFVETDTQFSASTAKRVAEQVTGTSLEDRNLVYTFTIEGEYIGGPSAGAAMTVATIAAIRNETVDPEVAMTGTIRPDGRVGQVGGILEKVAAAGQHDMEAMYVPWSQANITTYEQVVAERDYHGFRFRDIQYVPKTVYLNNVTQKRYEMAVRGVRSITEVTDEVLG